MAIDFPT